MISLCLGKTGGWFFDMIFVLMTMHTYYQGGFVSLLLVCDASSLHWVVILFCVCTYSESIESLNRGLNLQKRGLDG